MNRIFHHDDRAIDDHSEINCPQAHEIGTDSKEPHAKEADEHGKWNDRSCHDRCLNITEEREQNDGHKKKTFEEILFNSADRSVDHFRLVVERQNLHAGRQMHGANLFLDCLDDALAITAFEHDHRSRYGLLKVAHASAGFWRSNHEHDSD